jgi:pimeloyl-ACP methyl ester carboxylesterase
VNSSPETIELREGYADVGEVKLHYVEAGDGPLIVLLRGFPEFWYGWRRQIAPLAAAGFRVVAPDLRGYNLSSRPDGVAAYSAEKLAGDVRGLVQELGAASAHLVGHDGAEQRPGPPRCTTRKWLITSSSSTRLIRAS